MKKGVLPSFFLMLAVSTLAPAAIRQVPGQYPTIQKAINECNDGDVVVVEPDRYYELINFLGKNIVVTSTDPNDPEIVAETVIDGDGEGSVVTFESGETHEAVLTGFTIAGGYGSVAGIEDIPDFLVFGGGVYCKDSSPTIKRNVIANIEGPVVVVENEPEVLSYGAAIACLRSDAVIVNNIIKNNSAYAGGGIMTYLGNANIKSNLIASNSALIGGGVFLIGGHLVNNTIVANNASLPVFPGETGYAGNVYAVVEFPSVPYVISNNIICNATSGGGLFHFGVDEDLVNFNNVFNNFQGNYVTIDLEAGDFVFDGPADMTGRNGNISEDPFFFDPPDDYYLTINSPCINAGDPDYVCEPGERDLGGGSRIYALRVDIGAYEYVGYVRPVADAGPDQHVLGPELITLDASGSYFHDPCGVTTFEWAQIDGPAVELSDPEAARTTFTPEFEGDYRFELVVGDSMNSSKPDTVIVLVGNRSPVADAGGDVVCRVPDRVTLDGTGSYDPDPIDELTYAWSQLEGPPIVLQDADTATPFFDCNQEGQYVFELVVSDDFASSEPSTVRLTTVVASVSQKDLAVGYATEGYFHYPDVSGTKVVYSVGVSYDYSWDIKCKDLATGVVDSFAGGGIDTQPKIDGDIVVWSGGPLSTYPEGPECTSIFIRNVATGEQRVLRQHNDTLSYSHPAISGNKVVWLRHQDIDRNDPDNWYYTAYDICGADVSDLDNPVYFTVALKVGNRDPYPIDTDESDFDDVVDISGNIVVWEAEEDIYGADISNPNDIRTFAICTDAAWQYDPAVSGSVVVWTDERKDAGDIYGADISDRQKIREFAIATAPGAQQQPAIDGCVIVYVDGSAYGGLIRASCLTRKHGVMTLELAGSYVGTGPAIDGERIVWQTSTYGQASGILLELAYSVMDGPVGNMTSQRRYDYLQHAINDAGADDRIVAGAGVYYEDIDLKGKSLSVSSTDPNDPAVVGATVISGSARAVTFSGGVDANCVLAGFTVTGASRGIYLTGSSPAITKCAVVENSGSGLELRNSSSPVISNCSIIANGGSGLEMWPRQVGRFTYYNYPKIRDSLIAGNLRQGVYGGVPTITNCTIVANGLRGISGLMPTVTSSIVYYNGDGSQGAQIATGAGAITYSDVQGSWPGKGNMDAEPMFVELGRWVDSDDPNGSAEPVWLEPDYRLLAGSPCIDAGDPSYAPDAEETDLGGSPRLTGQAVDMGAYEAQPKLEVSEDTLEFEVKMGYPNPPKQILLVHNGGVETINWEVTYDADWLEVDRTSGSSSGEGDVVWLGVDAAGLGAGEHTCLMTISAAGAVNSPRVVRIELIVRASCFPDVPEYAQQYADFLTYAGHGADPGCWCASPQDGTHYQCDGDADGCAQGLPHLRIFTRDLALLLNNWKKGIDTADPCADFDHKGQFFGKYRVFTGDLSVLVTNWKKTDADLANDCPRPDTQ